MSGDPNRAILFRDIENALKALLIRVPTRGAPGDPEVEKREIERATAFLGSTVQSASEAS